MRLNEQQLRLKFTACYESHGIISFTLLALILFYTFDTTWVMSTNDVSTHCDVLYPI
jgi:hypothetical protein